MLFRLKGKHPDRRPPVRVHLQRKVAFAMTGGGVFTLYFNKVFFELTTVPTNESFSPTIPSAIRLVHVFS